MVIRQRRPSVEAFVSEFQESVIPSAIPATEFIDWDRIENELDAYRPQIDTLEELRGVSEAEFTQGLADALMAADDTREWIDFYFELLGHSGTKYTSLEGVWKFYPMQRAIDDGDRQSAIELAEVLQEIGLQYLVDITDDVPAHFRGMKVGMESHKRKNRGGACFEDIIADELGTIRDHLADNGFVVDLVEQYTTKYEDDSGQSKVVDFAFLEDGSPRVVFEANCYTAGGSKPSEIKRSYDRVSTRMRNDGVECVWITDGQAWESSLGNVLPEAYRDIIDLYNLEMVQNELADDILNYFENGSVGSEAEIDVDAQRELGDY